MRVLLDVLTVSILLFVGGSGYVRAAEDTLVTVSSSYDFNTTLERLTAAIAKRGLKQFAVIDHASGAEGVSVDLRPTTLVIFGHPKVGAPVMAQAQTTGLDLPLKILVTQGDDDAVSLIYRQPRALVAGHGLDPVPPQITAMTKGLDAITSEASAE